MVCYHYLSLVCYFLLKPPVQGYIISFITMEKVDNDCNLIVTIELNVVLRESIHWDTNMTCILTSCFE